jgi:hypothetical protein
MRLSLEGKKIPAHMTRAKSQRARNTTNMNRGKVVHIYSVERGWSGANEHTSYIENSSSRTLL